MTNVIEYKEKLVEYVVLFTRLLSVKTADRTPAQLAEIARLGRRISILKRWEAVENAHA